jgi:phosphatidylethanolamine/phosphatidyl-N-methylethanolamine N-methyltransferase
MARPQITATLEEARRAERAYDSLARVYDAFFDWALAPGRRRAIARLQPATGERVLEVGVGTGLSLPLYPAGCRVTGIDISEPMLERARERAGASGRADVSLRIMDAHALQFDDRSFDAVIVPYVVSVVPDPPRVMAEVARVVRPGGRVVVVNHFRSDLGLVRAIERMATPASWWLGFRLDLPLEAVTDVAGLTFVHQERVNLLGLWRVLEFRKDG